jgi:YD repeat-containing protein
MKRHLKPSGLCRSERVFSAPTFVAVLLSGLLASVFSPLAIARVDMRNANYTENWIDIPNLFSRNYNSRCIRTDMFGMGWGTDFDTHLEVRENTLVRVSSTCGRESEFGLSPDSVALLAQKGVKLREVLLKGPRMPLEFPAADLSKIGGTELTFVPVNRNYDSADVLTLTTEGFFIKSRMDGDQEFDLEGRLTKSYTVLLMRDDEFRPSGGFTVKWNEKQIDTITFPGLRAVLHFSHPSPNQIVLDATIEMKKFKATYQMNANGDVESVTNAWGNTFHYDYDRLHNITSIIYPDKTTILIVYDNEHDWVRMFKDRDDCIENYDYMDNPAHPKDDYSSEVTKTCNGVVVAHKVWHFLEATNRQGMAHLSQLEYITEEKGAVTHEINKYDDTGRLIDTSTTDNSTRIPYEDRREAYFDEDHRLYPDSVIYLRIDDKRIAVLAKNDSLLMGVLAPPDDVPSLNCEKTSNKPGAARCSDFKKVVEVFALTTTDRLRFSEVDGIAVENGQLVGVKDGGVMYSIHRDIKTGEMSISGGKIQALTTISDLSHQLSSAEFQKISDMLKFGGRHLVVATLMSRESRPNQ